MPPPSAEAWFNDLQSRIRGLESLLLSGEERSELDSLRVQLAFDEAAQSWWRTHRSGSNGGEEDSGVEGSHCVDPDGAVAPGEQPVATIGERATGSSSGPRIERPSSNVPLTVPSYVSFNVLSYVPVTVLSNVPATVSGIKRISCGSNRRPVTSGASRRGNSETKRTRQPYSRARDVKLNVYTRYNPTFASSGELSSSVTMPQLSDGGILGQRNSWTVASAKRVEEVKALLILASCSFFCVCVALFALKGLFK